MWFILPRLSAVLISAQETMKRACRAIRHARQAGTRLAVTAITSTLPATDRNTRGSCGETSYSRSAMKRLPRKASSNPAPIDGTAFFMPCPSITHVNGHRLAPAMERWRRCLCGTRREGQPRARAHFRRTPPGPHCPAPFLKGRAALPVRGGRIQCRLSLPSAGFG